MINWLKYTFSSSDTNPYIDIEWVWWVIPENCIIGIELFQLSSEYIREIVKELEEVKVRERGQIFDSKQQLSMF